MAEDKKYIGFDIGAESGRCVVAVLKNGKIKLHEVHLDFLYLSFMR